MQRVTRNACVSRDVIATLDTKVALIRKHFPPNIANLYATPRHGSDGSLEWWSALTGQPVPYHELDKEQQRQLLDKYQQRQEAMRHLADALQTRGHEPAADNLRALIGTPDLNNLYSINGDPLVVHWGVTDPVTPPIAPAPPTSAPPLSTPSLAWKTPHLYPWLIALALALLGLLWLCRNELINLLYPAKIESYACRQDTSALPPEFVTILDTSGSMGLNINANHADEQWFFSENRQMFDLDPERTRRLLAEPKRISVAKDSLTSMIDTLHPKIDTSLITFNGCDKIVDHGVFTTDQRKVLVDRIHQLVPSDGTPLAASLQVAASRVDGRKRDAMLVMFIDGADGCKQDVCAVARQIADEQPRLRVNLVNMSGSQEANCIAEYTQGRIYAPHDSTEVASMLRSAVEELSNNARCE